MKTLTVKIFILAFILAISGMSQAQVAKPKVAYVNNVDKVMAATAASVDNDPIIQMLKADTLIDVDVLLVKKDSVFDLSGYDVVIAQEGFGSSDPIYKPGGTLGMGSIPVPFILNKVFTMKAGRGFAAGALGSGGEVAGTFNININNTYKSHDLFKGMTNSKGLSQIFFSGAADNGDASLNKGLQYATGVVISSKNTLLASGQNDPVEATVCVNDIPAGDTIGSEVLKARMIAFGMNYGAICKDGNNLTPDGLTLWRNAVYSLAGITVPTTKVDNSNDIKSITSSVGMVKINGNAGLAELVLPAGAASATLTITPVTEGAVVTPATIEASAGNTYQVSVVAPIAGAPKVYTISVSSQKEGEILYVSSDSYGIYSEAKAYDKNVYDALVEAGYSVTMVKKDALNAEGFDYTPYAGIVLSGGAGSSNVNGYAKMGYPIPCVSLQNDGAKNDKWGWVNYKNAAQYAATKVYDVNTAQIKITNNTHPITEAYAVDEMVTWTLGTPDSADWAGKEIKSYNLTDSIPEAVALATIPADGKLFPVMWAIPAGTSVRSLQADNSYARIPTTSNIVLMYIYNDGLLYAAPGFDQLLAKSLNWAINGDQGTSNKKEIVFVKRLENNYDSIVIANIAARPEFNVTVVAQNVLTPDLLPQLNAADVVIMGRSIPSSDAGSGNAVWDAITAPVMSMNMYAMRGMAAKCYWTPNVTCENISNAAGVYLQANILAPNDPVFEGMPATIDWWEGVGNIFSVDAEGDDAGNGVLLAETADKRPLLIRWPAGVEYYPGSGHVPQSIRSYIGNGSDGGGAINYFNFSEDAKKIFFNELNRMANYVAPKEVVFVKRLENNYDSIVIANIDARPEFNVTVVAQNVLTPDLLPQLNAADVVIMGRSIPSSDAGSGNAVWDAITAPVMSMNMYAMRGMAAKCYWTPNVTCENISNAAGVYLQANILAPNDPVFEGMPATIDWWEGVGNIFSVDAEGDDAGNGVLLAETADKRPLLIRWPAGVEYYPGSGHVPQSPRSYMGNGSDGGGAINYFNFSEDAKKIFFNELARMASLPKPEKPNVDPLTIFDPATVDASALPDGMTIVEIDGTSYLQVVLNGWNSNLKIPEYTILKEGMAAVCNMKYTLGPNATAYDATKVNAVVQLMDTINLVPASWNPSQMIPAALGLMKSGPDGKMYFASGTFAKEMKIIHNVQFFGQETVSWGPTTGDTIWVGKIRAQYLEENVIFDPVNVDTSDVNVSIVDIGGAKYARVVLQGWNSVLPVPKFTLKEGMSAKTNIQYEIAAGKSYTAAQVNAVAQLMDVINLIPNPWNPTGDPVPSAISLAQNGVDGKLTEVSGKFVSEMKFVNQVQLFGQETVTWGPTIGDVMYCGKIVASLPAVAKVTFKVDDSAGKTHKDFVLRGSWKQATGVYDKDWDGGKDQTQMYDDGTHGDAKAGDNIWTVTLDLVSDGGTNTWEWGFLAETVWIPTANIQFKVADGKAQTSTFVIKKSGVETFGSNIKLYPNPTSGVLNISGVDVSTVEVYNLSGARMLIDRFTSNQVDVSSLSRGAYILKITSNQNQTVMRKFNKN